MNLSDAYTLKFNRKIRVAFQSYYTSVQNFLAEFNAVAVAYARVYKNDTIIDIPLIQCELYEAWAESPTITLDPIYGYDNLVKLPKEFARSQLNCYLEEPDILRMYTETLKTPRNDFYKYMIYQPDRSIVIITLAFEDKKFLFGIQQNHKKIEQFSHFIENKILANNPELLEYYNFYSIVTPTILKGINSEKIVPQYQLTKMENKCFLAIYNGYFTQEQLVLKYCTDHIEE